MRIGAHISVAGGLHKAFDRAKEVNCDSMLIFTKSNRQWKAKPLTEKDITAYTQAAEAHDIYPVAVHASYLINIASPKPDLWEKSYQALKVEVERADSLGIPYITFHPGSYVKSSPEEGITAIGKALQRLLEETDGLKTTICLETMAGQGTNLGSTFAELKQMIDLADGHERLGVCLDTCHIFAAGYDIRTPEAYQATMAEFDQTVGLDRIKCFHFNDSKFELGQKKDRHAHIGEGFIGAEGFAQFLNDPRWAEHPAHLETPKTEENEDGSETEMDTVNIQRLRDLIQD